MLVLKRSFLKRRNKFAFSSAGDLHGHFVFLVLDCCYASDHSFFLVISVKTALAKLRVYRYVSFQHSASSKDSSAKIQFFKSPWVIPKTLINNPCSALKISIDAQKNLKNTRNNPKQFLQLKTIIKNLIISNISQISNNLGIKL